MFHLDDRYKPKVDTISITPINNLSINYINPPSVDLRRIELREPKRQLWVCRQDQAHNGIIIQNPT